jgi:DNA-binding response OmpR family regulator
MRILIADDDIGIRSALSEILTANGYEICEAADGWKTMERIYDREHPPDIVLLDVMMPEFDGASLLRTLRKSSKHMTKIIIITAMDLTRRDIAQILPQANAVLHKPFQTEELLETIQRMKEPA